MSFVYEEIADVYRKKIEAGELSPGDKFPTYDEMVAEWNVSTNTVVEVRKVLYREGLITRGQGFAGTFVTDAMPVPTTPAPKRKSRRLTYISCFALLCVAVSGRFWGPRRG